MTLRQFAIASGVPYATLYDVAKGKRPLDGMSARHAATIAHALGMSVEELLGEEPPTLTADEAELLGLFRSLPPFGRKMALATVRNIAEGLRDE